MDEIKWYSIFMVVMVVMLFGYMGINNYTDSQEMQACVSSGQSWEHVRGDVYECK